MRYSVTIGQSRRTLCPQHMLEAVTKAVEDGDTVLVTPVYGWPHNCEERE